MLDIPFNAGIESGFVGEPHKRGPYGAKGIGEVAMVPIMPAIANAINNAMDVKVNDLPMTKERVWRALHSK